MIALIQSIIRAFLYLIGMSSDTEYRDARDDAHIHKGEW